MRQDLSKKMKANLRRFREGGAEVQAILHVGAAEHLVARGLIVKNDTTGLGRAQACYDLTDSGRRELAEV